MNDISALFAEAGGDLSAGILQGLGGNAGPPTISLKDDRFSFVDTAGERTAHEALALKVIVIGVNKHGPSKVYWGRSYDPKAAENERPMCWSDNGVGPSNESLTPQSETCATCPHNSWGSAVSQMTGKGIKACSDRKKLAVIVPEHNSDTVYLLNVPPASFGNLVAYVKKLAGHSLNNRKVELYDVITELKIEDKTLQFKAVGQTTPQSQELIIGIWKGGEHQNVVGNNDTPIKGLLAAPAKQAQIENAKQAQVDTKKEETKPVAPRGRPPGTTNKPKEDTDIFSKPAQAMGRIQNEPVEELPAFLRKQGTTVEPTVRSGVVSNAPEPDSGLSAALAEAFDLKMD